jgi:hypothetical protein
MAVQIETSLKDFAPAHIIDTLSAVAQQSIAETIAQVIRQRWIKMADQLSTSSTADYLAGIQPVRREGDAAIVSLVGALPNSLEHGQPAYDMRDTLLGPNVPIVARGQGRGKQQGKDGGFYRSIPFRHQTTGTVGRSSSAMGSAYTKSMGEDAAKELGKAVYKHAKALAATTSEPHKLKSSAKGYTEQRKVHYGARLPAGVGGAKLLKPHHKTDIHAGMYRMQKTYKKATQNYYMSFRTISTKNTTGWQRKATPGFGIMAKLAAELPEIGSKAIDSFLRHAGGQP